MHKIININDETIWHKERSKGLGGSDAACIFGLNPYKTNLDLWKEKTGRIKPEDISNKPAVKYGKEAEEHLRELFRLDYPEYKIKYEPYNIHCNSKYEFIRGTFDGELKTENDSKGLLEIKTTEIRSQKDWLKWDNRIPDNYFCQVLHYFAIDEMYQFCKLKAQIKYHKPNDDEIYSTTRHYHLKRCDYLSDIEELIEREKEFWHYIEADIEPPLILPKI